MKLTLLAAMALLAAPAALTESLPEAVARRRDPSFSYWNVTSSNHTEPEFMLDCSAMRTIGVCTSRAEAGTGLPPPPALR
jgi:hypothetical protein